MTGDKVIQVHGLPELQRALRQIDQALPRELAAALQGAAEIVRKHAEPMIPRISGDARASVRTRKSAKGAMLATGGSKAPYYPWLDFGGAVGRGRSVHRDFIPGGRYIYPALAEKGPEVEAKVDKILKEMAIRAGFETTGKG